MKKLFLLSAIFVLSIFTTNAQTVSFTNTSGVDLIVSLHQYTGTCAGITAADYYYDVPDNFSYTYNYMVNQFGNPFSGKVLGVSFQETPGGCPGTASFCVAGALTVSGTAPAPCGLNVSWSANGGSIVINFF